MYEDADVLRHLELNRVTKDQLAACLPDPSLQSFLSVRHAADSNFINIQSEADLATASSWFNTVGIFSYIYIYTYVLLRPFPFNNNNNYYQTKKNDTYILSRTQQEINTSKSYTPPPPSHHFIYIACNNTYTHTSWKIPQSYYLPLLSSSPCFFYRPSILLSCTYWSDIDLCMQNLLFLSSFFLLYIYIFFPSLLLCSVLLAFPHPFPSFFLSFFLF